jgi:fatty acid desaturase
MYAIHSDEAVDMMQRLPAAKDGPEPVEPSALTKSFREFRGKLKAEGWFKRQWYHEAGLLSAQLGTMAAATILAKMGMTLPALAVLSIAHTTGGWMAHDFVHGRGKWCSSMRHFGAFAIGLSSKWWSEKHNTHHAHTNVIGIDEDIMVEPAIWLWAPDSARDRPWRRFQHLFFPLAFSLTFAIWRIDSVKTVIREKLWVEGAALAFHYAALLWAVGPMLAFSHIFIAGAFTATMVTVTHTSEELLTEHEPSFVDAQFRTTRDAKCHDPISQYLWGGMQYQLEHHLFPTMPRYKYPSLAPVLQKWAESNGLEYRVTDQWKIIADNIKLLRDVAKAPSEEGSPHPQLGKISSGAL